MYKIFVKGNYFYIERLSDGRIFEGHKKNVLVSSLTETSEDFYFWNINGTMNCDNVLNIADLVDENSIAFTVATFREFIEENTGNFNSGVPAALNGQINRLINYFADDYSDLTTNVALTPVDGELAIVRNAQGTSWLPYNLGGTYYPKGSYIYDGANWIPQTDLITQQLEINIDDINGLETDVANHVGDLANPHAVTKTQVGLSNVDNTSDVNKPISNAVQIALNSKEDSFTKNTAFNKNFGTTAGTVAEGNDSRLSDERIPINDSVSTEKIQDNSVTNVKLATVPTKTYKGRTSAGTGDVEDLTVAQLQSDLGIRTTKAGKVLNVTFAGNPKKATVTFATAFADAEYSPSVVGNTSANTSYNLTVENITANSFVISANTNNINNLIGVRWIAIKH